MTAACTPEKKADPKDAQAAALYGELCATYKVYADSLAAVSDSATTDSVAMRLDDRVRRIYLKYPPDLDVHITEAQNDTIWRYASRIASLRARMRHVAAVRDSLAPDSIARDSVVN